MLPPSPRLLYFDRYRLTKAIARMDQLNEERHADDLRGVLARFDALAKLAAEVTRGKAQA